MKREGVDAYIIPTADFHGSEYVGEYFKTREYMSGFTGSAGTMVVLKNEALLWTDGRYFIQAEEQLKDTGIRLMKIGQSNVPDIADFLFNRLNEGDIIGFDGRTISCNFISNLEEKLKNKEITLLYNIDLIDEIWIERTKMSEEIVWELSTKYAGVSREEKIKDVREKMGEYCADTHVLTSLDDIAWLLNLRGNDIECNPVFLSYMIITKTDIYLYAIDNIFSIEIKNILALAGVEIKEYNSVYTDLSCLSGSILLDKSRANYSILKSISSKATVINKVNPTTIMKAVKNEVEIENMRKAHIKDGIAVTKFMYWLKSNIGKEDISEISAAKKLESYRMEQEGYLGPSFEPIMAYDFHGAINHYSATEETNLRLETKSLLLSDTGGQYYEGTTDITRTYVLGELTDEQKKAFTLVLKGNLNLAAAKFLYGVRGINLDYLARGPLWEYGMDYNHGTGHGIGYLLNVHEGPNGFRWKILSEKVDSAVFEEGMITSNEPGFYEEGKYGIRHENLILCKKDEATEYGQFMSFENLTLVPFDLDGVEISYMTNREVKLLNKYHKDVYNTLSPYFSGDELEWLKNATRQI